MSTDYSIFIKSSHENSEAVANFLVELGASNPEETELNPVEVTYPDGNVTLEERDQDRWQLDYPGVPVLEVFNEREDPSAHQEDWEEDPDEWPQYGYDFLIICWIGNGWNNKETLAAFLKLANKVATHFELLVTFQETVIGKSAAAGSTIDWVDPVPTFIGEWIPELEAPGGLTFEQLALED